ncbi:hypothetical protein AXF42_Ash015773 [Apostasia shenzhenica]|uniref:Uncharacterized protein n=1 Tax=Apostasia shenzhenica TaxID=1088818 RepID=A0A2H9ZXI0_9ASPA|nr:hypothetical protein AXF42_Ash015773 [Apostasia shenzhenica]
MMSHGRRPLLLLLLLLVFSDGVRTEEDQLWKIEPIQSQNFKKFMDMGRGAVNAFNREKNLWVFDGLNFCRTEEVQKKKVGNGVLYALTILATQGFCFSVTAFGPNFCTLEGYKAVVAVMPNDQGYILQSVLFLPGYSPRYNKNCV